MKNFQIVLFCFLCFLFIDARSQNAPVTSAPTITNVTGSTVTVPVTVSGFSNIMVISLTLEYDPTVLTFQSASANSVFGGGFLANSLASTGGKRKIVMSYMGLPISSLPNGSHLVDLVFAYTNLNGNAYSELKWKDDGSSCEYADAQNNPLVDTPTSSYYINGLVTSHISPRTKAEVIAAPSTGVTVSVPINVWNFNSIGSFSLTLDYNSGVLTYLNATPNPSVAATLSVSAASGRILIGWYYTGPAGTSLTLGDSTTLLSLNFTYNGGTSPLTFYNNGGTCEYTEGVTNASLYDLPTENFYINGSVSSNRTLNVKTYLQGLYNNLTHSMDQARNAVAPQFSGNTADQVSVEIHDAANYSHIFYTASGVNLSTTGQVSATIPAGYNGQYYVTIRHRNSIETTSALPVSLSGSITGYSFDAAAKAYGNNMVQASDGAWMIYAGDVTQDGIIDGSDMAPVDNLASSFASGYIPEDCNGDGLIDGDDLSIVDNNAALFIGSKTP